MKFKFVLFAIAAIGSVYSGQASAQAYAITNARIVTVSGQTIDNGTIVIRNGLIESVGPARQAPADAEVINGSGLTVYPGFIDALTNLGMPATQRPQAGGPGGQQSAAGPAAVPASNSNYPAGLRPEEAAIDDLKAGDSQFEANRNAGFTTALTTGRSGIFTGRSAVINLAGEKVSSMVLRSPFAYHVSFVTIGGGQYPASLLGTFSALRQILLDAQRLQELEKAYAANPRGVSRPEPDRSLTSLYPLINREVPVVFNANREIEIVRALDLAKEFNLRAIIAGGQEAWKVADRLKAQDVPVLLSLNFPKRTAAASPEADSDSLDLLRFRAETPKSAARLAQAGVRFAFQSGGLSSMGDYFTNAGKTIENGLSRDAAVKAMTLSAAQILGVDDRTGSLEPGKIANITAVKGDLFGKDRFVSHVFVDGKLFEPKEPAKQPAGRTATGTPSALPNVGGNYAITIEIPGQSVTGTLALDQQGAVLTGTIQTQVTGTANIKDGKVTNEGFTFSATVEYAGNVIDIIVKGSVTGNNISGTIDSPQGPVPFAGTRNP